MLLLKPLSLIIPPSRSLSDCKAESAPPVGFLVPWYQQYASLGDVLRSKRQTRWHFPLGTCTVRVLLQRIAERNLWETNQTSVENCSNFNPLRKICLRSQSKVILMLEFNTAARYDVFVTAERILITAQEMHIFPFRTPALVSKARVKPFKLARLVPAWRHGYHFSRAYIDPYCFGVAHRICSINRELIALCRSLFH